MISSRPTLKELSNFTFRVTTSLAAAFFVLWITFVGILAVLANPYLIVAYWFLGFAGLFACCGAFINSCPLADQAGTACHPVRAAGCLLVAGAIGWMFWTQAKPAMASRTESMEALGTVLAMAIVLGLLTLVLLSVLILMNHESDTGTSGTQITASH